MINMENIEKFDNGLIFKDFRFRCHRLGDIMTNLPGLTAAEEKKMETLAIRKIDAKKGKSRDLTPLMEEELQGLIDKKNRDDVLPTGAKSYLDDVFDEVYWRRKRILTNKYLDKGLMNEQDVLALHSRIDNDYYEKNKNRFFNDYLEGTPDNISNETVRDAKANFDLESFRKAHLSTQYLWQLKGYMWLTGLKKAQLMYGLVNNPLHQLTNANNTLFYQMGNPDDDDEEFLKAKMQIERNMIFDHNLFIEEYPQYRFYNPIMDFDMPEISRVKKFDISLEDNDILNMKTRVTLARIYLCEKEIAERRLNGTLIEK
jgi:hypothetical protein